MDKNQSKQSKCLVLDSNQKFWPKNVSMYFMGFWCLENIEGSFLNNHKYNIINSKDLDKGNIKKSMEEIYNIYNSLILEISDYLNKYHKTDYSKRYWEILIGPWLKIFLGIVNERYLSMKNALEKYKIEEIVLTEYKNEDFYVSNVSDLEFKASTNLNAWNNILYTKIFDSLSLKCKVFKTRIEEIKRNEIKKKISIKKKIINLFSTFSFFSRKSKYFIYLSGLKFKDELILKLSLKQFPFVFKKENYSSKKINLEARKQMKFFDENLIYKSEFEKIVRSLILNLLPTDILENFKTLKSIVKKINWPKKPKLIFTSVAYHGDEVFKLYTANQIEQGTKYILGQHGANYFTSKNTEIEPGFDCSDKFYSWGEIKEKKSEKLFNINCISLKYLKTKAKKKKIYFFMPKMSRIRKRPWDDYGQMIRENISMEEVLFNLEKKIRSASILKLYPNENDSKFLENKILKEIIFKRNIYEIDKTSTKKYIYSKSKLVVSSGDGTAFLETITADIPVVALISNFNWIIDEARKDYEKLIDAKILFLNEKEMAQHINEIYDDIEIWWKSEKVQTIKKFFEKKYAQPPPASWPDVFSKKILNENI